ncbi:DUF1385 domain-containing protein, partial [bacterium]|nr:DUF1385 domain-containing protein [bacterium]
TPEGDIAVESRPHVPYSKRNKFLGWPIVRGAVSMVEALVIGIRALNWSAEHAMPPEEKKKVEGWKKNLGMGFSIFMGLVLGLLLFMLIPYWFARAMGDIAKNQLTFHLLAGALRICLLLGYMILISFWKDIRRIFQYHGSEHKSIFAYEKTGSLDVASAMAQTRFHPRCGTSFLLIVALSAIAFFAIVDTIIVAFFGQYPGAFTRFLVHLPLVPIVAGLSYEILKFSGKRTDNPLVKLLIAPGLWLQRITTQEPEPAMCEVALTALREALPKEEPIEESAVAA